MVFRSEGDVGAAAFVRAAAEPCLSLRVFVVGPWCSGPTVVVQTRDRTFSGADAHPRVGHDQATVFGLGRQSKFACKFLGGQCESNPRPYLQPQAVYHKTNSSWLLYL
ncbi:hypothetical protein YC2023_020007 [Brassica napus]